MGLWDELEEEVISETGNIYLTDPDKGFELVSKLLSTELSRQSKWKTLRRVDYLLDHKLLETSEEINLSNELLHYRKLQVLSDKLYQQNKVKLLKGKSVVGIGGKFSAGKSKFINAVIGTNLLPEDQTPTTSIATYLVKGAEEEIRAYTFQDEDILLDVEAAKALTHAFHEQYGLGFSNFLSNLVIRVPSFQYEGIVILDTPGYSKFDQGIKKSITDAEKAFQQLKSVDDLIWLVDIENGVIQNQDIEFIKSLHLENPVLVVFNKADKKTIPAIMEIVENSKMILEEEMVNIFDVIAYSALYEKEYTKGERLKAFLKEANERKKVREDIKQEILDVSKEILAEMNAQNDKFVEERNFIGSVIFRSLNVMELRSLVTLYGKSSQHITEMNHSMWAVESTRKMIEELMKELEGNGRLS